MTINIIIEATAEDIHDIKGEIIRAASPAVVSVITRDITGGIQASHDSVFLWEEIS